MCITQTNWLMLLSETVYVCCLSELKLISMLCGQNTIVRADGTYSNHRALKGLHYKY